MKQRLGDVLFLTAYYTAEGCGEGSGCCSRETLRVRGVGGEYCGRDLAVEEVQLLGYGGLDGCIGGCEELELYTGGLQK